jgi:oxygen-independent coproporphyrinogen-3 oxidase
MDKIVTSASMASAATAVARGVPRSVYAHIPFCLAKCSYCDFNSYAGKLDLREPYVRALCAEGEAFWRRIVAQPNSRAGIGEQLDTLYVGGGTPTVLSTDQLAKIVVASAPLELRAGEIEITVEANPGTVDLAYLGGLRRLGVNRLSLGAQSMKDEELVLLGRIHSVDETRIAISLARRAGFDNISLDLMYGLPKQTVSGWRQTLAEALSLGVEHLSLYALTVEEGTPLAARVAKGEVVLPGDDDVADMYALAEDVLSEAGYEHYEISNWARPGRACRHNLAYWANVPYAGFGAGAHSYIGGHRCANVSNPDRYMEAASNQAATVEMDETIGFDMEVSETIFLGLRRDQGIGFAEFRRRFGCEVTALYGPALEELADSGLLQVGAGSMRLTRRGRYLSNEAFVRFLHASDFSE